MVLIFIIHTLILSWACEPASILLNLPFLLLPLQIIRKVNPRIVIIYWRFLLLVIVFILLWCVASYAASIIWEGFLVKEWLLVHDTWATCKEGGASSNVVVWGGVLLVQILKLLVLTLPWRLLLWMWQWLPSVITVATILMIERRLSFKSIYMVKLYFITVATGILMLR